MKFNIFISFNCNYKYFYECLCSLYSQKFDKNLINLFITDDGTDREDVKNEFIKFNSKIEKILSHFPNKFYRYKNKENSTKSKIDSIKFYKEHIGRNDIIAILDGDDKILGLDVLQNIYNSYLQDNNLKIIFGKIQRSDNIEMYNEKYIRTNDNDALYNNVRQLPWACWHLKTFRAYIYLDSSIEYSMFTKDNEWLIPDDQVLMFEMIEQNRIDYENINYYDKINYYYRINGHNPEFIKQSLIHSDLIRKKEADYYTS